MAIATKTSLDQVIDLIVRENRILFESEDLIAVDKPSGLNVDLTRDPNIANLRSAISSIKKQACHLCHRIDKDTSGLVLLAKNSTALESLLQQFKDRTLRKTYLALTTGQAKAEFSVSNYLKLTGKGKNQRMMATRSGGDFAKTDFQRMNSIQNKNLIVCKPHTGRTHQIRVHLAELGLPIVNDRIYANKPELRSKPSARLMLHAWKLEFKDPKTKKNLELQAPTPAEFLPFFVQT